MVAIRAAFRWLLAAVAPGMRISPLAKPPLRASRRAIRLPAAADCLTVSGKESMASATRPEFTKGKQPPQQLKRRHSVLPSLRLPGVIEVPEVVEHSMKLGGHGQRWYCRVSLGAVPISLQIELCQECVCLILQKWTDRAPNLSFCSLGLPDTPAYLGRYLRYLPSDNVLCDQRSVTFRGRHRKPRASQVLNTRGFSSLGDCHWFQSPIIFAYVVESCCDWCPLAA